MDDKPNIKFGIKIDKQWEGFWSLGSCISHTCCGETYLFINLIKWSISIGWLAKEGAE